MVVDVSHLSERGFWDMTELAEKPIVASHSNSAAMCRCVRNLTDEQFRAICQLGGLSGINLYSAFLTEGRATFEDVRRHIDHFLELGGDGHIALGADLDGCKALPEGFSRLGDYEKLAEYLTGCGYSDGMMQKLFCDSWMKVVKACTI